MLIAEEQMELVVLKKHGESIRSLSRSTGRSRNTVRRYLREGAAAATRKLAPKRAEKLDPYKKYIIARMAAAAPDVIPAVVLLREIQARGYDGGYSRVKQFVRGLVPASQRNTYGRGAHRFHPGFLDYLKHAGALPRLCQPYRAQTKGKVERFIGYLKRSFWVPFVANQRQAGVVPDKYSANAAVARWLRAVANARVHATTEEVPAERLIIERAKLQGLPAPYRGRSPRTEFVATERKPMLGYQHPLSVYDDLVYGPCVSDTPGAVA